ncbi:hypothetical protein RBSWK_05659 [Rhodopirellula baltica SWK14]|uniref:Uncharacterized protein n=1 Tax=Rhodopirellula baltica SWK14 TaxID=993516 RepID=L7C9S8_RHOBT|nr:hypothetical protein RBSWK_05659 [Rhodopirellula baltica SWK14]
MIQREHPAEDARGVGQVVFAFGWITGVASARWECSVGHIGVPSGDRKTCR